ncbi:hypothetical protein [Parvicella tangerina]|uniref:hypothetical protein n=1 Tax=Parvicella tangerina TaxID=2829795 RepID=UPI00215C1F42|nr:hypothetical protein [Parvicella tangerina]
MIKVYLLFILSVIGITTHAQSSDDCCTYAFVGLYQGLNIYVQNPLDQDGIGFSVKNVQVNGQQVTEQVFSSAFKIDLSKHHLSIGDSVTIQFYYNSFEQPRIINPGGLTPFSNAAIDTIWFENDTVLHWCSSNEHQKFDYVIEQYRWNKWIKSGEVKSTGTSEENCYSFVPDLHAGENTFRIVQYGSNDEKKISDKISLHCKKPKVKILSNHWYTLEFSDKTMYEIYDEKGTLLMKGFSKKPNTDHLDRTIFYVNFGNELGIWRKI